MPSSYKPSKKDIEKLGAWIDAVVGREVRVGYCKQHHCDELRGDLWLAVAEAVASYDVSRGTVFTSWAYQAVALQLHSSRRARWAHEKHMRFVHIDAPSARIEDSHEPLLDALGVHSSDRADVQAHTKTLARWCAGLTDREKLLLQARLDDRSGADVGREIGVSRERVRQLNEALALKARVQLGLDL